MEIKKVVCIQCHNGCRLAATIDKGRLVSVEPDTEFPGYKAFKSTTTACPRRRNAVEYFYHPDRLNYPLKRMGGRGENKWQKISWEEALSEIGAKMKAIVAAHGPEAIGTTSGTGRTHDEIRQRFLNLLGTPNHTGAGQICYGPFCAMCHTVFGWRVFPVVRPETRTIILWGGGGPRYWDVFWKAAVKARKENGARIIVIDPRGIDSVKQADLWLQIRPGTDTALALGMIHHIIENDLHDKAFVAEWCHGFDALRERARHYPLDKVSDITWIPQDKIRQAAEWYAGSGPAVISHGMGIEHQPASIQALHAHFILPAICGHIDEKGGDIFTTPLPGFIHEQEIAAHDRLPPAQIQKTLGNDRFRFLSRTGFDAIQTRVEKVWGKRAFNRTSYEVFAHGPTMYRAILTDKPYPLRGMITLSSNPMITVPNTKLVYEALKKLDLYVVMDFFMTPSAQLADYVLPATTYLERPWIWAYSGIVGSERAMPKTVSGQYDRRDDYDFWRGLGLQLGQALQDWPWETLEDLYDYRLAPLGTTFKDFMATGGVMSARKEYRAFEKIGFGTPSGKIELSSNILKEIGYDPLPDHVEPPESPVSRPDLAAEYPFILITGGRHLPFYHSEHRQVRSARKMHPDPLMQMHPTVAEAYGISAGDWVWIESPRGRVKQRCEILEGIDPRVIHAQHGWWFPEMDGAAPSLHGAFISNINVLTDDDPDVCNKIHGGWPLRSFLCKIYKAEG